MPTEQLECHFADVGLTSRVESRKMKKIKIDTALRIRRLLSSQLLYFGDRMRVGDWKLWITRSKKLLLTDRRHRRQTEVTSGV